MLTITKDVQKANLITHMGTFHGDDVIATVLLKKYNEQNGKNSVVCRLKEVPLQLNRGVTVYDIGGGMFDHHQKGGNGVRPKSGIPYAACGLVWKRYGTEILMHELGKQGVELKLLNMVWSYIDRELISGVDAVDNRDVPKLEYPAKIMNISAIISGFNPTWDAELDYDSAFVRAVEYAEVVFENTLNSAIAKAKAKAEIEKYISKSKNGIMILDRFMPWSEFVFFSDNPKAKEICFVVHPSARGGYNWQAVPDALGGSGFRKSVPKAWWGLEPNELQKVTGIKTAFFCHPSGFIGGADTLDDTVKMAQYVMNI